MYYYLSYLRYKGRHSFITKRNFHIDGTSETLQWAQMSNCVRETRKTKQKQVWQPWALTRILWKCLSRNVSELEASLICRNTLTQQPTSVQLRSRLSQSVSIRLSSGDREKIERRREERGELLASKWIRAPTSTPKLTWEVFIPASISQKISNLNAKCFLVGIYNSECNVV